MSAIEICSPVASSMSISRGGRAGSDLGSLGDQVVGRATLGRDDDDDLVAGVFGADGLASRFHDSFRVLQTRPAEFLNHKPHSVLPRMTLDVAGLL